MPSTKLISVIALSFLSIIYSNYAQEASTVKSTEPGSEECIPLANKYTLGNGKIVTMTLIVTHFSILNYTDCKLYSNITIDGGKPYKYDDDKEINEVIPYHDTFDVFDRYQKTCTPCRYNDRGERIELNHTLKRDADNNRQFDSYFVEPIKTSSGDVDGYFYGFTFLNKTTLWKILDKDYKVVKERLMEGQTKGHSILYGKPTICYELENYHFECQLLDSDLNTIATIKMNPCKRWDDLYAYVMNLPSGGAMVSTKAINYHLGNTNTEDVAIQQIHADGKVEPAIKFDKFTADYLSVYDFENDKGDYCLQLGVEENGKEVYHVIKCVTPKAPKKD